MKGKHPQWKLENQLCKIDSLLDLNGGESGDQEEGSPQENCGSGSCCGCHVTGTALILEPKQGPSPQKLQTIWQDRKYPTPCLHETSNIASTYCPPQLCN